MPTIRSVTHLLLVTVLALVILHHTSCEGANVLDNIVKTIRKPLENYAKLGDQKLDPVDYFLLDVVPVLVGQSPNDENGTRAEFQDYLMRDNSNDDAAKLSVLQLIERSGYRYEVYETTADDGYVTRLTRIVNPLADPSRLRQPPVLMEHGGAIGPAAFLIASSIQHHPEKWPRSSGDGEITSWNKSLAFVLANNGFDVWMAETRGSDENSLRRIQNKPYPPVTRVLNPSHAISNNNLSVTSFVEDKNPYWSFSQDDIIDYEIKSHMDAVMNVTGFNKLIIFTYSISSPTTLAFLSSRPDYAEKVQGIITMAPVISGKGTNPFLKVLLNMMCPGIPDKAGPLILSDIMLSEPVKDLVMFIAKIKPVRYSIVKAIVTIVMGPSAKYQTLLDLNVLGHLLKQISFRQCRQWCQQIKAKKLQRYDYGPEKNQVIYGNKDPAEYNISNLTLGNWILVSATNDKISPPEVIQDLIQLANRKPAANIVAPRMNHLDLIVGLENDIYVNKPILDYMQQMSYAPEAGGFGSRALGSMIPMDLSSFSKELGRGLNALRLNDFDSSNNNNVTGEASKQNATISRIVKSAQDMAAIPVAIAESVQDNINTFWKNFDPLSMLQPKRKPKEPREPDSYSDDASYRESTVWA